jgi:hypothetical protein
MLTAVCRFHRFCRLLGISTCPSRLRFPTDQPLFLQEKKSSDVIVVLLPYGCVLVKPHNDKIVCGGGNLRRTEVETNVQVRSKVW